MLYFLVAFAFAFAFFFGGPSFVIPFHFCQGLLGCPLYLFNVSNGVQDLKL